MLENLDQGLKATNSIVALIEKIASGILNIKNNKEKKKELDRLIKLLNETRISRTLNAGLIWYLRQSVEDYKSGKNKRIKGVKSCNNSLNLQIFLTNITRLDPFVLSEGTIIFNGL